jgi:glutamine amidotransferase
MIAIVDLGIGNVGSIHNMLERIDTPSQITSDPRIVQSASKIILPGVGAFGQAMTRLRKLNLLEVMQERVLEERVPILGICLGMQLLTRGSEEGGVEGLGWIAGEVVGFKAESRANALKVPHMGWNTLHLARTNKIFDPVLPRARYYFVHSYYVVCSDQAQILATTSYGVEFVSAVTHDNIVGTQFHPEKSHRYGVHLLRNFATS